MKTLMLLVHHRWNIDILAELSLSSGAKFVTLANRLGMSRSSLQVSLRYLADLGLVERNSGYGHPMRPEYLLTERGKGVGRDCVTLSGKLARRVDRETAHRKWSLPLVAAIGEKSVRFNALRSALGGPTPRSLTLALKSLQEQQWVRRKILESYPPGTGYELSDRGLELLPPVLRLCGHAAPAGAN